MFREMRRFKQQLDEALAMDVLEAGRRGTLAVLADDGYPYTVPLNYWYDREHQCVYFHGAGEGQKIDAVRRCDKASFNVLSDPYREGEDWWYQFNSITLFGRVTIVVDADERKKALTAIGLKYYPDHDSAMHAVEKHIGHITILRFQIEHMSGKHINEK